MVRRQLVAASGVFRSITVPTSSVAIQKQLTIICETNIEPDIEPDKVAVLTCQQRYIGLPAQLGAVCAVVVLQHAAVSHILLLAQRQHPQVLRRNRHSSKIRNRNRRRGDSIHRCVAKDHADMVEMATST